MGGGFRNRPALAVIVVVVAVVEIVAIMIIIKIIIMIIIAAADIVVSILQGLAADWFPQGPVSSSIRVPVR